MSSTADPSAGPAPNWTPVSPAVAYRGSRENVIRLLADRPQAAEIPVLACPDWTVRSVVDHLLEICRRIEGELTGQTLEKPPPGPEAGLDELLDAWAQSGERAEPLIDGGLEDWRAARLAMDVFTHEIDLFGVMGEPVPEDHPSYPGAMNLVVLGFTAGAAEHGLTGLRIEAPGAEWKVGEGEPTLTVSGSRHDMYRSLVGRRTHTQIGRLAWSGSPEPWLPAFAWGPFKPPPEAVEGLVGES